MMPFPSAMMQSSPPGGKDYWRFLFTNGSGGNYLSLSEAELRATSGGVDLTDAGYSSVFASSNSAFFEPYKAFDNVTSGGGNAAWSTVSGGAVNSFVGVRLLAPSDVNEVLLRSSSYSGEHPRDVTVQSSTNGTTWTNEWSFTCGFTANLQSKVFTRP